jgi:phospholipid transport system substrate-binding protein
LACGLVISSILPAAALEPRDQVTKLLDAIKKVKDPAQGEAAKAQANASLAIAELSRRSLGEQWDKLDEPGRQTFVSLLTKVLEVRAYPKSADFFKDLEVKFGEQTIEGEKAVVKTTLTHPKEGQVDIDYKLRKTPEGGWVITEVLMDEVPMGANLRSQIRKVLTQDGYEELLKRLRDKTKEAEEGKFDKD